MPTALVTGATGLVGSHVAERLAAEGWRLTALVRESSDVRHLEGLGARLVVGDLMDAAALAKACAGAERVFHAAAQLGEWAPRQRFVDLNVTAVRRLLGAAADAGATRVVHVSSVAVYGRASGPGIAEGAATAATGHPYVDTKVAGERALREAASERGIEIAILRPCMVYGARDRGFLPHVCRNLRRGRQILVGSGRHLCNTVYAGTLAELAVAAATHPRAAGEAFNAADPDPLSWRELLTALAVRLSCPVPHLNVPRSVARATGLLMETMARAIGSPKPPPMTRFVADVLGADVSYSTRKAEDLLGFRPRLTVREGLELTLPSLLLP